MKRRFEHFRTTCPPYLVSDGKLGRVYGYYACSPEEAHWVYVHVFSAEAAHHREHLALRRARPTFYPRRST